LLVRSACLGGARYDPDLSLALDLDLSIAVAANRPVYHIPEVLIGNRYHGTNQTGILLARLVGEMTHIARKNGILLKPHHLAMMRLSGRVTSVVRQAFLWYAGRTQRRQPA
jgi:hypothetical protein